MTMKLNRNDPCSCGSGKKYKNCCMKKHTGPRRLAAKWINAPQQTVPQVNLIERTFGSAIQAAEKREFVKPAPEQAPEADFTQENKNG